MNIVEPPLNRRIFALAQRLTEFIRRSNYGCIIAEYEDLDGGIAIHAKHGPCFLADCEREPWEFVRAAGNALLEQWRGLPCLSGYSPKASFSAACSVGLSVNDFVFGLKSGGQEQIEIILKNCDSAAKLIKYLPNYQMALIQCENDSVQKLQTNSDVSFIVLSEQYDFRWNDNGVISSRYDRAPIVSIPDIPDRMLPYKNIPSD